MHFDFEDRGYGTPTISSAISWREQFLVSLFSHLIVLLIILFIPQHLFTREAQDRQNEALFEADELLADLLQTDVDRDRTFIFVQPRVDLEALNNQPDVPFSDQDRQAQSPFGLDDPQNQFPNAEGNSEAFVESDTEALDEVPHIGIPADTDSEDSTDTPDQDAPVDERTDADLEAPLPSESSDDEGEELEVRETIEDLASLGVLDSSEAIERLADPDPSDSDSALTADGLLGRAMRDLDQYVRRESFANRHGSVDQYAPWIQFDTKGVEFGPWVRRFVAQIRRNWFIPYAALSMHGRVVLTFFVDRNGNVTDLTVLQPSIVDAFTNSAFNALKSSNPTRPLPEEYPDDEASFTVTFFFNESPPV